MVAACTAAPSFYFSHPIQYSASNTFPFTFPTTFYSASSSPITYTAARPSYVPSPSSAVFPKTMYYSSSHNVFPFTHALPQSMFYSLPFQFLPGVQPFDNVVETESDTDDSEIQGTEAETKDNQAEIQDSETEADGTDSVDSQTDVDDDDVQAGYVAKTPGVTHVAPLPEGLGYASHHLNLQPAPGTE